MKQLSAKVDAVNVRVGSRCEILAKSRCFLLCLQHRTWLATAAILEKRHRMAPAAGRPTRIKKRRITPLLQPAPSDGGSRQNGSKASRGWAQNYALSVSRNRTV